MKTFSPARCTWRITTPRVFFQRAYRSQKLQLVGLQRSLAGRSFPVLDPDRLERHARPRQLAMHPCEVDGHTRRRLVAASIAQQLRLELHLAQLASGLPREPHTTSLRPVSPTVDSPIPLDGRQEVPRVASPALVLQPQNLSYLPHRHSLRQRVRVRDEVATARAAGRRVASESAPECPGMTSRVPRNRSRGHSESAPAPSEWAPAASARNTQPEPSEPATGLTLPRRPDVARADALLRRIGEEVARRWASGTPGPLGRDGPEPPEVTWNE